jgi:hypothetical protein
MLQQTRTILCTALLTAAAAGCSGGGSGGGSADTGPDLVQLSSANAKTIAGAVLASSLEGEELTQFAPAAGSSTAAKPQAQSGTAKLYSKVESIKDAQTASLLEQDQIGDLQATAGRETTPCMVSGTVTLSGNLASTDTLTVGDTITAAFAGCDDGVTLIDGTFAMKITRLSGDITSDLFAVGVDVTLTSFSVTEDGETVEADGSLSFFADSQQSPTITTTVTADSLTVTNGTASNTLADFSLTEVLDSATTAYSVSMQGTLTSTAFSGSVTFATPASLQGTGEGHAASGELLISGANGGTLHVIVLDGVNVRLELDADGNGLVDETIDAVWDELT